MPLDFTFFAASKEAPQTAQEEGATPQLPLCLQFLLSSLMPPPIPAPPPPAAQTLLLRHP